MYSAHQCVEHDNVNVLCLGAQIIGDQLAKDLIRAYLSAQFSTSEEFRRRVAKLAELEQHHVLADHKPAAYSRDQRGIVERLM
jgi:ribose 5-phosphate isomerase RpiB